MLEKRLCYRDYRFSELFWIYLKKCYIFCICQN